MCKECEEGAAIRGHWLLNVSLGPLKGGHAHLHGVEKGDHGGTMKAWMRKFEGEQKRKGWRRVKETRTCTVARPAVSSVHTGLAWQGLVHISRLHARQGLPLCTVRRL
eukprot:363324-Chlamydomonas_euryale.AAC.17